MPPSDRENQAIGRPTNRACPITPFTVIAMLKGAGFTRREWQYAQVHERPNPHTVRQSRDNPFPSKRFNTGSGQRKDRGGNKRNEKVEARPGRSP